jgi:hypothetical protein
MPLYHLRLREAATATNRGATANKADSLGFDASIRDCIHDQPMHAKPQEQSHQQALARVCRQLREEMLLLFHSVDDFCLQCYDHGPRNTSYGHTASLQDSTAPISTSSSAEDSEAARWQQHDEGYETAASWARNDTTASTSGWHRR